MKIKSIFSIVIFLFGQLSAADSISTQNLKTPDFDIFNFIGSYPRESFFMSDNVYGHYQVSILTKLTKMCSRAPKSSPLGYLGRESKAVTTSAVKRDYNLAKDRYLLTNELYQTYSLANDKVRAGAAVSGGLLLSAIIMKVGFLLPLTGKYFFAYTSSLVGAMGGLLNSIDTYQNLQELNHFEKTQIAEALSNNCDLNALKQQIDLTRTGIGQRLDLDFLQSFQNRILLGGPIRENLEILNSLDKLSFVFSKMIFDHAVKPPTSESAYICMSETTPEKVFFYRPSNDIHFGSGQIQRTLLEASWNEYADNSRDYLVTHHTLLPHSFLTGSLPEIKSGPKYLESVEFESSNIETDFGDPVLSNILNSGSKVNCTRM